MVYTSSQISESLKIGTKTRNLKVLKDMGLKVPEFVAFTSEQVRDLWESQAFEKFAEVIQSKLRVEKFAVRSSALIEDTKDESFAGQFHTEINVLPNELAEALKSVVSHAERYLNGDLSRFSLLIQEYVEAEYSGVVFTRNPSGGREMVCEYYKGIGEKVVGGEITPESYSCYWGQKIIDKLPGMSDFFQKAKNLENEFEFPQDIEWCMKRGQYYFLQTRPVTTLSQNDYEESLYLDENLPTGKFFYEKNEISEIAPRPSDFTFGLLQEIYAAGGPVAEVYKMHGLTYHAKNFLVLIGNELYVDRQKELVSLFPGYGYKESDYSRPRLKLRGFLRTIKNFWSLQTMETRDSGEEKDKIFNSLGERHHFADFKEALDHFLKDYRLIFEVNLLSQKAVKGLEQAVKHEDVSFSELLVTDLFGEESFRQDPPADLMTMKGNSLDVFDLTAFSCVLGESEGNVEVKYWFDGLPHWKKDYLKKHIIAAQNWSVLREYGRWLTVKNVNYLRQQLMHIAQYNAFKEVRNVFFVTPEECLDGRVDERLAEKRANAYEELSRYSFPSSLTSVFVERKSEMKGVSAGVAEGKLVLDGDDLSDGILYTKILSPGLADYFDKLSGIISEEGGMLSHLAIIAREKGIPVVVNANIKSLDLKPGDIVRIDGSKGEILRIDKK